MCMVHNTTRPAAGYYRQPGSARTANRNGNLVLVAQLHDGSNLFGAAGEANGLGHLSAVDGHFVVRVILADVFANVAIFLADNSWSWLINSGVSSLYSVMLTFRSCGR